MEKQFHLKDQWKTWWWHFFNLLIFLSLLSSFSRRCWSSAPHRRFEDFTFIIGRKTTICHRGTVLATMKNIVVSSRFLQVRCGFIFYAVFYSFKGSQSSHSHCLIFYGTTFIAIITIKFFIYNLDLWNLEISSNHNIHHFQIFYQWFLLDFLSMKYVPKGFLTM